MELEKQIEEVFRELGLSRQHAKIYLGLVYSGGRATAEEIIKRTGLPASTVYKGLKELENKGLVLSLATKPKSYMIVSPSRTINQLIENKVEEILAQAKRVSNIIEASILSPQSVREPVYSSINGWSNIISLTRYIIQAARNEVLVFTPIHVLDEFSWELEEARHRGVYVSLVLSNKFPAPYEGEGEEYSEIAVIVRERLHGSRLIILADNREALLAPVASKPQTAIIPRATYIEDPELMFILSSYFYNRIVPSSIEVYYKITPGESYTFTQNQTALDYIEHALREKMEVEIEVEGYDTETKEPVKIKGIVYDIVSKPYRGVYSILVNTGDKIYSIGGYRAFMEEISARTIKTKIKTI